MQNRKQASTQFSLTSCGTVFHCSNKKQKHEKSDKNLYSLYSWFKIWTCNTCHFHYKTAFPAACQIHKQADHVAGLDQTYAISLQRTWSVTASLTKTPQLNSNSRTVRLHTDRIRLGQQHSTSLKLLLHQLSSTLHQLSSLYEQCVILTSDICTKSFTIRDTHT